MHTKQIDGVVFNYNSDLSGLIRITAESKNDAVWMPMSALREFCRTTRTSAPKRKAGGK